jgi:glycerophosphoryl diester phosphodiesterase
VDQFRLATWGVTKRLNQKRLEPSRDTVGASKSVQRRRRCTLLEKDQLVAARVWGTTVIEGPWYLNRPIAHRGLHNIHDRVIEHSREAIRRAIAAGLPIEVDIESSADHVNFVIHDTVLDNLTSGHGVIRELPAAEVRKASLRFADGEPIMLLEELLEFVHGRVPLVIDFKSRDIGVTESVQSASSILDKYRGEYSVQSFNPFILEWFAEHFPRAPRGLITADIDKLQGRSHYLVCMLRKTMGLHFISHHCRSLNCWTFQWALETNLPIIAWTIRNDVDWEIARTFAQNMFFEYVEPDKSDWRIPARSSWRAMIGERVDRRLCIDNQTPTLTTDTREGPEPWWTKDRYWPPDITKKSDK